MLLNHHETFHEPPPGSKTHLNKNGEPSDALQNLSLSVLDAFGSVHDILYQSNLKHQWLADSINALPMPTPDQKSRGTGHETAGPFCHDDDLLLLKATSQAGLACMENALALLQDIREAQRSNNCKSKKHDSQQKSVLSKKGLLSPMNMSPSRKISNSSTNSTFYTNDQADHMVSNSSLNQPEEAHIAIRNLGTRRENRSQLDTLSLKSAVVPPMEQDVKTTFDVIRPGLTSALSRSTPTVGEEQRMEGKPQAQSDKLNTPKKQAQGQSS